MKIFFLLSSLACGVSALFAIRSNDTATDTPLVDLGYEIHQGTLNETGDYYLFTSVPYAEQPVGTLRFQKPVAISGSSSSVNNGSTDGTMCFQAYPQWIIDLEAEAYGIDSTTMAEQLYAAAGQTESCLLLDVYVPTAVFNQQTDTKAPVLLWLHGGGFAYGSKDSAGNPSNLVSRSLVGGGSGVIVVTINYRLGLFGWLAGGGMTPNLGLHDQRMALEWVNEHITQFGGDPDQITVMGESAGAASILHHITSYGGAQPVPFQNAIPQSPAFQFSIDYEASFQLTLSETVKEISEILDADVLGTDGLPNVTAVACNFTALVEILDLHADKFPDALKAINQAVVQQAETGEFKYGVVVDGDYVPDLPQVLLARGSFDSSIKVMNSHTSNESVPFVSTALTTDDSVRSYVEAALSNANSSTVDFLLTDLYPAVFDGTYPWYSQFGRAVQMTTDFYFACSTNFLAKALGNTSHNYIFAYPPGYHAGDVSFVFFNGGTTTLVNGYPFNATLAATLQDYLVRFAMNGGDPNGDALPVQFPEYGFEGSVLSFEEVGVVVRTDDMMNDRCDWIQQAMVDGLISHM